MRYEGLSGGVVPYLLGAGLIAMLALILHQVLREAVRKGASLQISYAERSESNWRCSAAHGPRERESCIALRTSAASEGARQSLATADVHRP